MTTTTTTTSSCPSLLQLVCFSLACFSATTNALIRGSHDAATSSSWMLPDLQSVLATSSLTSSSGTSSSTRSLQASNDDDDAYYYYYDDSTDFTCPSRRELRVRSSPSETLTIGETLAALAAEEHDFTILIQALKATGLWDTVLDPSVDLTLFAPTDNAFQQLGKDKIQALLDEDVVILTQTLLYHVVGCTVTVSEVLALKSSVVSVPTLMADEQSFHILVCQDGIYAQGWANSYDDPPQVIQTDIETCNGVIHVIDQVLLPKIYIDDDDNNKTPTAPSPTLPPVVNPTDGIPSPAPTVSDAPFRTIAQLASDAGIFQTLLTALTVTNLVTAVDEPLDGPLTVFAPTDTAFANLGDFVLDYLLEDSVVLTQILEFHVLAGIVTSQQIRGDVDGSLPTLLDSQSIQVVVNDDDDDSISVAGVNNDNLDSLPLADPLDLIASNGIVHVVDQVLLPLVPVGATTVIQEFTILARALIGTGLIETLNGGGDTDTLFTLFAPTDTAFANAGLDEATVNSLIATDVETLINVLSNHVILDSRLDSASIIERIVTEGSTATLPTALEGSELTVTVNREDRLFIFSGGNMDRTEVVMPDILATNGILHAVDRVLLPDDEEDTAPTPTPSVLPSYIGTSFYPSYVAPTMTPSGVTTSIYPSYVPPTMAPTGVTTSIAPSFVGTSAPPSFNDPSIYDIAYLYGYLTIIQGWDSTPLGDFLDDETIDPVTALIPNDDAFANVSPFFLNYLINNPVYLLQVLEYHVIEGEFSYGDLTELDGPFMVPTLNGQTLEASFSNEVLFGGNGNPDAEARVVRRNVEATNGIVHEIDQVLLPYLPVGVTAVANNFTLLTQALIGTGLMDVVNGALDDPAVNYTVFAPTNDAFLEAGLDESTLSSLLATDVDVVTDILLTHVIGGVAFYSQDILDAVAEGTSTFLTLSQQVLTVSILVIDDAQVDIFVRGPGNDGEVAGDAQVLLPDVVASNGVVHVISQLLFPSTTTSTSAPSPIPSPSLSTVAPTTVPTPGGPTTVPTPAGPTTVPAPSTPVEETIYEVAQNNGFTTLTQALDVSSLATDLDDPTSTPLTVFAPTDGAFNELGQYAVDYLLGNVDILTRVLTYHVLDGVVTAADLEQLSSPITLSTLAGPSVDITFVDFTVVFIEGQGNDPEVPTQIIAVDIPAVNGIVHVLDQVLLPYLPIAATAAMNNFSLLVRALIATDLMDLLNGVTNPNAIYTVFAPTNAAFANAGLTEDVLNSLLVTNPNLVTNVVQVHVIEGAALNSTQVVEAVTSGTSEFTTISGFDITVSVVVISDEETEISLAGPGNGESTVAQVISPNVVATNGIIHVIDQVLLPDLTLV